MGLILDSSVLIAGERAGYGIPLLIRNLNALFGEEALGISVITVAELHHGVARAKSETHRLYRQGFVDEACQTFAVYPVSLEIAKTAGNLQGELAAKGISFDFEDLLIGVTALELKYDLVTLNERHFRHVPGLNVKRL